MNRIRLQSTGSTKIVKLLVALVTALTSITMGVGAVHADLSPTDYDSYTSCGSIYITGIGVSSSKDTITVFPNWAALSPTAAYGTWLAANKCSASIRNASASVRNSLYAQLTCHVQYNAGLSLGGRAWDLERWRSATWNSWTWVRNKCNW